MSVWIYSDSVRDIDWDAVSSPACLYCKAAMVPLEPIDPMDIDDPLGMTAMRGRVYMCPVCGWWSARRSDGASWPVPISTDPFGRFVGEREVVTSITRYGAAGSLRELDLTDTQQPLQEVRQYLAAKYEARFELHPRLFEETVASIWRSTGYTVTVTAYSKDGGIDLYVLRSADERVNAVQVKRTKNAIGIEQIDSFAGALMRGGHTQGVFVTTSRFTRGAVKAATSTYGQRLQPIELVDAKRFYDALEFAQRRQPPTLEEARECLTKMRELSHSVYGLPP